jgi:translocation and assembly module TamA
MRIFIRPVIASFLLVLPTIICALSLQVKVSGVDENLRKSILAELHIHQATTEPKVTVARIRNLYDLAEKQIIETLQAKGYYDSKVTQELVKTAGETEDKDLWVASFHIDLGKPTKISKVSVIVDGLGKDDKRIKELLDTPLLAPGKVLSHADYEDTKERLISDINAIGYLQAEFTENSMLVDRANLRADITFKINTGMLYRFGKITFEDCMYPDSLLVRYLPFHTGEPYNLNKLMDFQNNLESADLFSKIRFDPSNNLDDPNDNVVPINVRLTPKPRNRYTGSVGYGTDTGPRASVGWLHRRTATPGHKVLSLVSVSKILRTAKLNYIIPGKQAATDSYIFGANLQEEHIIDLRSRKAELSFTKTQKRGKLESFYGINYFTEHFRLTPSMPSLTKNYLLPNAKWIWIHANPKDDYDFGTRLDLGIRGGLKSVLSATNVVQTEFGVKQVIPLIDKTRLLFRVNGGSVTSREFGKLPPSLRFFTGGDESVRGFAYNSLGPREIKGDPRSDNIGGKYLFVISAEIERKLYQELSGAIFYDTGNAVMKFDVPLAKAAGFGVRYKTPIGNFRVDLAKPLNTVLNKHWRIHVTFGTDF